MAGNLRRRMKRPAKVAALNSGQDVISLAAPTDPPKAKHPTLPLQLSWKDAKLIFFEEMATVCSVCIWRVERKLIMQWR